MIATLLAKRHAAQAVFAFLKTFGRPLLYLACIWLIWTWDTNRIEAIRTDATAIERARWQNEIAVANARIAESQLAAERAAREADARAATEIATLRRSLEELEKANAALPNATAGGLDRDRVRLLRGQPR